VSPTATRFEVPLALVVGVLWTAASFLVLLANGFAAQDGRPRTPDGLQLVTILLPFAVVAVWLGRYLVDGRGRLAFVALAVLGATTWFLAAFTRGL